MASEKQLVFSASVASVKTLADGGIRVSLDLPEQAIAEAASLMQAKRDGVYLRVAVMAEQSANGWGTADAGALEAMLKQERKFIEQVFRGT